VARRSRTYEGGRDHGDWGWLAIQAEVVWAIVVVSYICWGWWCQERRSSDRSNNLPQQSLIAQDHGWARFQRSDLLQGNGTGGEARTCCLSGEYSVESHP